MARDGLRVALEGVFAPFMMREVPKVVVQSDHNYHSNEDWLFRLQIDRASALRIKFDPRCKTELDKDYLQFFKDEACQERLHEVEKISGEYPSGWPELRIPGDDCWVRFCSNASEEHWGWKFAVEGLGPGGGGATAVRFSVALRLLAVVTCSAEGAEPMRILALSALLALAASLPDSPEAAQVVEAMGTVLAGHQVRWSDAAWHSLLVLVRTAQTGNSIQCNNITHKHINI